MLSFRRQEIFLHVPIRNEIRQLSKNAENGKKQMNVTPYWESWSPYLHFFEDTFLDLESIEKLASIIEDPVLVIGAGQGLLVERLRAKGFDVDGVDLSANMIKYAKKRRGIELVQADARKMPFADSSYRTSVIATGVIDFMDDEEQVKSVIMEAKRVTDDSGRIFVAFYKYHPEVEQLMKRTGLITKEGFCRFRRMHQQIRLGPMQYINAIGKDVNICFIHALLITIKVQMFLPRKEKKAVRNLRKLWKQVENPASLLDCAPEVIPYRKKEQIRRLFENLEIPVRDLFDYYSCTVAKL